LRRDHEFSETIINCLNDTIVSSFLQDAARKIPSRALLRGSAPRVAVAFDATSCDLNSTLGAPSVSPEFSP
jgi:hypothetical protein